MRTIIFILIGFTIGSGVNAIDTVAVSIDKLTAEIAKHPAPIRMPGL